MDKQNRKLKLVTPRGLRKRNGMWHYRVRVNGHEYTGPTDLAATAQNVNDALQTRVEKRTEIKSGKQKVIQFVPFSKALPQFKEWCDGEYQEHPNSAARIMTSMASAREFFKNEPVSNIHEGKLENYKTWRRSRRIKDVTLHNDLCNLSVFFQYAKTQRWCETNPVDEIEIPSGRDAVRMFILNERQEKRYFEEALEESQDLYDLGRIMTLQGPRPEETMVLEWEYINLIEGWFRIVRGKSRASRRKLNMYPETIEIFKRRLQNRKAENPWVFPSPRRHGYPITKLNNRHNDAAERAGLDEMVIYDLRHTCATRWAQDGTDPFTIAAWLGHGSLGSVMKYVHIQEEHQAAETRRLIEKRAKKVDGRSTFGPLTTPKMAIL